VLIRSGWMPICSVNMLNPKTDIWSAASRHPQVDRLSADSAAQRAPLHRGALPGPGGPRDEACSPGIESSDHPARDGEPWNSRNVEIARAFGARLIETSRFEEAERLLLRYHEGCEEAHGAEHESTRSVIRSPTKLYEAWGREEQAAQYRQSLPAQDADSSSGE